MRKDEILNILHELDIPIEKWTELFEIETILLSSGVGIHPNWKYYRFLFTEDGDLLVKHGSSKPYGGRLSLNSIINPNGTIVQVDRNNPVPGTEYYESFRLPDIGDTIRLSDGQLILSESVITKVTVTGSCIIIDVFPGLSTAKVGRLSFYKKSAQGELAMHATPIEGIYMNFLENPGKTHKKFGIFHECIKSKQIQEINLKLQSKYNQKLFKLRGGTEYGSRK